jgi:hypothetical protein
VDEGCALTAADEIAAAVHHVLCILEAEATYGAAAAPALRRHGAAAEPC